MNAILSFIEVVIGFFILLYSLIHINKGFVYVISCLLLSVLFFYWAFRKRKQRLKRENGIEKKTILLMMILNVVADILIPMIVIYNKNGELLSLILAFLILFGVPYLIGKYIFTDKSSDLVKRIFFFIVFPVILFMTALIFISPFEMSGVAIIFFPVAIGLWFLQTYLIKILYKKDKYIWWHWFFNALSPFWIIWMRQTFKNNFCCFLYVIGALLIDIFVLKKKNSDNV